MNCTAGKSRLKELPMLLDTARGWCSLVKSGKGCEIVLPDLAAYEAVRSVSTWPSVGLQLCRKLRTQMLARAKGQLHVIQGRQKRHLVTSLPSKAGQTFEANPTRVAMHFEEFMRNSPLKVPFAPFSSMRTTPVAGFSDSRIYIFPQSRDEISTQSIVTVNTVNMDNEQWFPKIHLLSNCPYSLNWSGKYSLHRVFSVFVYLYECCAAPPTRIRQVENPYAHTTTMLNFCKWNEMAGGR